MKALEILREYRSLQFGWNDTEKREEISEAIAELEALQQPKRCDGCWYGKTTINFEGIGYFMNSNENKLKSLQKHIDVIFDEYEAQLKAKDEEIERLKSYIEKLWQIVDDIDTYGDMAKSNDAMFRSLVENKQKERWELPITTDGYKFIYKEQQ